MRVAKLGEIRQSVTTVDTFYGYNHNLKIGSGEFYREENMSADDFPVLAVRGKRWRRYGDAERRINGICWLDGLWMVVGDELRYPGNLTGYQIGLSDGQKRMVPFGAYIIILPDNVYFNTRDHDDYGKIEDGVKLDGATRITFDIVLEDGFTPPMPLIEAEEQPQSAAEGSYWLDTSEEQPPLMQLTDGSWAEVTHYVKIMFSGATEFMEKLQKGDRVWLTADGLDDPQLCGIGQKGMTIVELRGNYITVSGSLKAGRVEINSDGAGIACRMPKMDYVFEHENRLWGCRYGEDNDGNFVNEIYASKMGDFKNWNSYEGISTDSYTMSCGTDGPWTGAMEVGGYPTFWKERYLHKVYGDYPAQYSCSPVEVNGVAPGAADSMAIVDGVLYYNGVFGVCRYDGSLPTEISGQFGDERFLGGVGGSIGKKYYVSFANALMVYDTSKRIWHRESPINAMSMVYGGGELHYVSDGAYVGLINNLQGMPGIGNDGSASSWPTEKSVKWYFETGIIGGEMFEQKRIQRIDLRMALSVGTRVRIMAEYDSGGVWEPIASQLTGMALKTFTVPLRPKRCDHLRLRLEGEGEMRLMKITYITEKGSDLR